MITAKQFHEEQTSGSTPHWRISNDVHLYVDVLEPDGEMVTTPANLAMVTSTGFILIGGMDQSEDWDLDVRNDHSGEILIHVPVERCGFVRTKEELPWS